MKRFLFVLACAVPLLISCNGRGAKDADPTCAEDLIGRNVSVIMGSTCDLQLSAVPGIELTRYSAEADMLLSVQKGLSDFCVVDSAMVLGKDLTADNLKVCYSDNSGGGDACIAFRYGDEDLCGLFNEFLASIRADGTYADMRERWTGSGASGTVMPALDLPAAGTPLRISVMVQFPFVFIQNGEWAGFEMEMLRRFSIYAGRPLSIEALDFGSMMAALLSDRTDLICSFIFNTPERAKQVLFSDPYFHSNVACIGRIAEVKKSRTGLRQSIQNNLISEDRWKLFTGGLEETLFISFFSIIFGTLLGAILCWLLMCCGPAIKSVTNTLLQIVRGIPILVFLMIMFYVVFASTPLTARWVAVVAFSINFGAFVCEIFKTGIAGVDKGQREAGLALGFSPLRTFSLIVLPQALKNIIPIFKNEVTSLVKNTSIVGYIAIVDLTKASDIVRSRTFDAFFSLILISILYFLMAWLFGLVLDLFYKKLK